MELVEISFPGLGIDTFTVNKIAFTPFGLEVRWYGICIVIGMMLAFAYALYRAKQEGFTYDNVLDLAFYLIISGIVGARLYYVLMEWDSFFMPHRSLWDNLADAVNIRGGGLAIYGGIIAGAAALVIYCRLKKLDFRRALDMVAPGVMIAQAMGRWGNFFNGEAHGSIVAEGSPLYFLRMGLYPSDISSFQTVYVHPTFLYESLWNILGFVLINALLYRRKKFHGQIVMTYLAWYGFGRMWIEGLRTDSLYLLSTGIRVSQLVGFLCFAVFGGWMAAILWRMKKTGAAAACAVAGDEVKAASLTDASDEAATNENEQKQESAEQSETGEK